MRKWSSLLGALGAVFLVFGLVGLITLLFQQSYASPLAVGAAQLARQAAELRLGGVLFNLFVGVVLIVAYVVFSIDTIRERMRSEEGRRAGRYGTSAILSTLLGLVILGMLAFLSARNSVRFDWTEQKVHTLSEQSRDVLASLDQDVRVTGFLEEPAVPPVEALLERYAYASDRFTYEFADPNARPDLVESYGVDQASLGRGLLHVSVGGESVDVTDFTEETLTNALVKLTRGGGKKVYFVEGHNEAAIEGEGADAGDGFAMAATAVKNENYAVAKLLLGTEGKVPDDADAVVLAGPTRPFLPQELSALRSYVQAGGKLMVLLDPRARTNLYDDLETWGVRADDDMVIDFQQSIFLRPNFPVVNTYGDHAVTREMSEITVFPVARSVSLVDGASQFDVLARAGPNSFGETNLEGWGQGPIEPELDDADLPGPVPLAVAGHPKTSSGESDGQAEASLVVIGDSTFASNEFIDAYGNRDLFLNAVNWLVGDVEHITVRPRTARASRFYPSNEEFQTILYLSFFVLPQAIAIVGVFAWWSRRRSPGR